MVSRSVVTYAAIRNSFDFEKTRTRANIPANLKQRSKVLSDLPKHRKAPARNDGTFYPHDLGKKSGPHPPLYPTFFIYSLPIPSFEFAARP